MDNKYYTDEELRSALQRAVDAINAITKDCKEYTRGTNDCFALLRVYDEMLRGSDSRAGDLITFSWNSPKEFLVKLKREGFSIEEYSQYCGYETITNKRPKLGDIAFDNGALLCNGDFWLSTSENNIGVVTVKQKMFLEPKLKLIARPMRS